MPRPIRIAVLVSGGGSNLEAILQAQKDGALNNAEVVLVLSSKAGVIALDRAKRYGIPAGVVDRTSYPGEDQFQVEIYKKVKESRPDLICLAGYLKKLGPEIIGEFRNRILNVHPALLPKFGGPGMYGHFVHEAVLAANEKESGCTVHVVDEQYDHGRILAQARVPVLPGDTPETLAARVLAEEHRLYPKIIREFCEKL